MKVAVLFAGIGGIEVGLERTEVRVTKDRQPQDTLRVLGRVAEIPRPSASSEVGFDGDGIGVSVLDFRNDCGPALIEHGPPAPQPGDTRHNDSMIVRMANEYDTTFAGI